MKAATESVLTARNIASYANKDVLRGVVFDMDGTLTRPNIDFPEMYRRCGIDRKNDIIQVLSSLPKADAKPKWDIIHQMEEDSMNTMQLTVGSIEVINWLSSHNIPIALVTRNTYKSTIVLQNQLQCSFDYVIARDNTTFLPKPNPESMNYIVNEWNMSSSPSSIIMVGDSTANDIAFGKNAGTRTCLLDVNKNAKQVDSVKPDITLQNLYDLPKELCKLYTISGPLGTNVPLLKYNVPVPTHPLTIASARGDIDSVQKWMSENMDEDCFTVVDDSTNTALIWACDQGHDHIVDYLLKKYQEHGDTNNKSDYINQRGYLGATAACRAARRGHCTILEQLCESGADLNVPNKKLQYPLHFAAFKENMEAVRILLKYGASTKVLDRKGRIPAEDTKCSNIRNIILISMQNNNIK